MTCSVVYSLSGASSKVKLRSYYRFCLVLVFFVKSGVKLFPVITCIKDSEIDLLYNTIFLPIIIINCALSVYAASDSDLTPMQRFLGRCFKRKYMSKPVSVYDFLER